MGFQGDITMKSTFLLIVIIIGATGLEPIATVVADIQDNDDRMDGARKSTMKDSTPVLPFIAGILFIIILLSILLGQKHRQKSC